jgi:hypothetical protein
VALLRARSKVTSDTQAGESHTLKVGCKGPPLELPATPSQTLDEGSPRQLVTELSGWGGYLPHGHKC